MNRKWYLIDAKGQSLGRLATRVANLLRGKEKPEFEYYKDVGDFVVVINTCELDVNLKRAEKKVFYRHSGYPGGLKSQTLKERMEKDSTEVFKKTVYGMLPGNRLRKNWIKRLKVYKDANHKHGAQNLEVVKE